MTFDKVIFDEVINYQNLSLGLSRLIWRQTDCQYLPNFQISTDSTQLRLLGVFFGFGYLEHPRLRIFDIECRDQVFETVKLTNRDLLEHTNSRILTLQ
jgi:hypothetical protein